MPRSALYPQGDTFCFTFYSTKKEDTEFALRHGATAIGPYYGDQKDALAYASQFKAPIIYKVNLPCMAGNSFVKGGFTMPDDRTIIDETAAVINGLKENPYIAYWDIVPEELRHWKKQEMHYLELVTSAIRANDPLERPIYMYEPNHRDADALARTIIYQDICAKGMYVESVGMRDHRIWCRWSMEQELEAIKKSDSDAEPWIVLWMARDADKEHRRLIKDWCRHDAYLGLIMGGKGIQIWSGYRGRKGFENDFDLYFKGYLSVAKDLNGPKQLGPFFLYGQKKEDVTVEITSGPEVLTLDYQNKTHTYPPVTYTVLTHQGQTCLFAVNSANEPVTAIFHGFGDNKAVSLLGGESVTSVADELTVLMEPLAVRGFRLETDMSQN